LLLLALHQAGRLTLQRGGLTVSKSNGYRSFIHRRRFLAASAAAGIAAPWVSIAHGQKLETVRMACWSPKLSEEGNVFVSDEKGYFKEQGIALEWIPGQGSGDALKNMLAGNGDIAFCGPEALFFAADKGSKLKIVYDIYPQNAFNVFALKKMSITKPADL